jgi:hypothetical protein
MLIPTIDYQSRFESLENGLATREALTHGIE